MGGLTVTRMGYGAMQLAGPGVFGPPKDHAACVAVLRAVVDAGINHIDTSDFYGPEVTNQIIKEALYPYPDDLVIVTKVGADATPTVAGRTPVSPSSSASRSRGTSATSEWKRLTWSTCGSVVFDAAEPGSVAEQVGALAQMQQEGLIKHVGLSTVNAEQVAEAQSITPVVCVQNLYNIANRADDALIDGLTAGHRLRAVLPARRLQPAAGRDPGRGSGSPRCLEMTVALAWLLQRSPNILLIPGTTSSRTCTRTSPPSTWRSPPPGLAELNAIAS